MIKNITNGRIIIKKHRICRNVLCKAKGLMFSRKPDYGLVFLFDDRRVSLHMFFVFFPIDVLFVRKGIVVEKKEGFKPFTAYMPSHRADTIIELPDGKIKETKTKIGDKISVV